MIIQCSGKQHADAGPGAVASCPNSISVTEPLANGSSYLCSACAPKDTRNKARFQRFQFDKALKGSGRQTTTSEEE